MSLSRLILVCVLACAVAAPLQAQTVRLTRVTADQTSLRDQPNTDGRVVAPLVKGDELEVVEQAGTWWRVRVVKSGATGFVHGLVVEPVAALPAPRPVAPPPPVAAPPAPAVPVAAPVPASTERSGPVLGVIFGAAPAWAFSQSNIDRLVDLEGDRNDLVVASGALGLSAGASIELAFTDQLAVHVETLLSIKGGKIKYDDGTFSGEEHLRLTYAELPIMGRFHLTPGDSSPFVNAGVTLSYLVRGRLRSVEHEGTFNDAEEYSTDVVDELNRFDHSLVIGGGMKWRFLSVEARYTHGIRRIDTPLWRLRTDGVTVRNRSLSVLASYQFR